MSNTDTVGKTILEWAATRIDEAVFDPKAGYYPFSIIADAFEKGIEYNEDAFTGKMRKRHYNNASLVVESITSLLAVLKENNFIPTKIFVSISVEEGKILFSIKEEEYITDHFGEIAYSSSAKTKLEYYDKGLNLQLGFLNDSKEINLDLIKSDGYDIAIDVTTGRGIF